uniref:Guanylate kinase-like domain-containing protein n=1 Tax=Cyprinus carpio TaxID=7962 RepID=A0A8C1VRJ3_CYPCA
MLRTSQPSYKHAGTQCGRQRGSFVYALKVLKTAEFMPYVVFIASCSTFPGLDVDLKKTVDESARILRAYRHYFDLIIVNDNLDGAFEKLQSAVDQLCTEPQWVPVSWVY